MGDNEEERNTLAQLLRDFALVPSATNRQAVYAVLQRCTLLLVPENTGSGNALAQGEKRVSFTYAVAPSGEHLLAAFTSEGAIRSFDAQAVGYAQLPFADIARIVSGSGGNLVIDPGGPVPLVLPGSLIGQLALPGHSAPSSAQGQDAFGSVQIGIRAPRQAPSPGFVKQVKSALARFPHVVAGYLVQTKVGESDPYHAVFVQFKDEVDKEAVTRTLEQLNANPALDFGGEQVRYASIDDPDLMQAAKEHGAALS